MRIALLFMLTVVLTPFGCAPQVQYADLRSPNPDSQCRLMKVEPDDRWLYLAWDCGPEIRVVGTAHYDDTTCDPGDWGVQLRNELYSQPSLGEARPLTDRPGNLVFNRFCLSKAELAELVQGPVRTPR